MNFSEHYNNESDVINELESLNEGANGILNTFYKLTGKNKRAVNPTGYTSFVIGSKGYATLLNNFATETLAVKAGKKPKRKIYITNVFEGVPPNINKLNGIQSKTSNGKVDFWEPVEKVNECSMYTTNISVARSIIGLGIGGSMMNASGEIILWDVMTKDDFTGLGDVNQLKELGWEEGVRQFVLSVNERGKKYWMQLTGMTLGAWVTQSKIGSVNDPYGFALKDDIGLAKKQSVRSTLTTKFISKDVYDRLVPNVNESVNEAEILVAKNATTGKWGKASKDSRRLSGPFKFDTENNTYKAGVIGSTGWQEDPDLQDELDSYIGSTKATPTTTATIAPKEDKSLINKYIGTELQAPAVKINTTADDAAESGWVYTFKNGGKFYLYTLKNAPDENAKYKIAYDAKGKSVIERIPEVKEVINRVEAKGLNLK